MFNTTIDNVTSIEASNVPLWQSVVIGVICCCIIVATIIGNVMVCAAVCVVRKLRTPCNVLIISLATADLLVACLVMPPATVYEIVGSWIFGSELCDVWTCLDVLLCTASILNLCVISVDRYLAISRPLVYALTQRTCTRMTEYTIGVWLLSALISVPPLFGLKSAPNFDGQCIVNQSVAYQLFATIGSFYLPLFVMIVIYARIYVMSERLAKSDLFKLSTEIPLRLSKSIAISKNNSPYGGSETAASKRERCATFSHGDRLVATAAVYDGLSTSLIKIKRRRKRELGATKSLLSKEHKAIRTLGVIMGAFIICWLPFFFVALVRPFCIRPNECVSPHLMSLLVWLGYINSLLNPIIYACFNRDFRTPFCDFLLCRCRGINARQRLIAYSENYGSTVSSPSRVSVQTSPAVARYGSRLKTM